MTYFTLTQSTVRASLFKPSGKWYEDFELDMAHLYRFHPADAVKRAWARDGHEPVADGWKLVVLDPYNQHSHPVMIVGRGDET